jgi:hypothetical protein
MLVHSLNTVDHRLKTRLSGSGSGDPVPVRLRLSQKREKKIMFEEFSVGLEASP